MEPALRVALEAVHLSPVRAVVHVTGGAAQSLGWVMAVPGASRTVLEARVPYARTAMVDVLGAEPSSYVSAQTAMGLARAAYKRGVKLSPPHGSEHRNVVGVGCTCALASVPAKKGAHRCVVATFGVLGSATYELLLQKGLRDRWEEDGLASRVVVQALADAAVEAEAARAEAEMDGDAADAVFPKNKPDAVEKRHAFTIPMDLTDGDALSHTRNKLEDPIASLLAGDLALVELIGGTVTAVECVPAYGHLVLPGSFNPLHVGHREMLAAASLLKPDLPLAFELAVSNVDKGTIHVDEVVKRAKQFEGGMLKTLDGQRDLTSSPTSSPDAVIKPSPSKFESPKLLLTRAPFFSTKAALLPGSTFVVGHDTAIRLVMARYYGGETNMFSAFAKIRFHRCSFIVAGRKSTDGEGTETFLTLADVGIPPTLKDLFQDLPGFRNDVSSTEIRERRGREV
jgi:hypothetical protein